MKRNGKVLRAAAGIFLSAVLVLSACGTSAGTSQSSPEESGAPENTGTESDTQTAAGAVKENTMPITTEDITLEIYCGFAGGARQVYNSMADMDLVKQMMEETGINLKFVHPPEADDGTYFTTMIASGEYPDIISNEFTSYPGGPTAAMDDGVLLDATDLINEHAYYYNKLLDTLDPEVRTRSISDDGRIVRFGTVFLCDYLDGIAHGGFIVRKDLLDKAGITELPETIEEYETMFDAFKEQGVTPWSLAMTQWQFINYSPVANAFGLTYRGTHLEDGKVIYSRTSPKYKDFLEVMKRWYDKGYFSSDALTQLTPESQKTFQAGNAGAILSGSWEIITLESVGQANDPELKVVGLPYPRVKKGDTVNTMNAILENPETRCGFISAKCEHPVEAVRFVDYLYKPETMKMTAWGVNTDEATLWTEDANGKRQWTDFISDNPDFDYEIGRQRYTANALQGMWDADMEKLQYDIPQVQQAWGEWKGNTSKDALLPQYITQTTEESREISDLKTALETYGDEMAMGFITGQVPLEQFDEFTAQLKAIGSDRICELYQAAYDRYLAR